MSDSLMKGQCAFHKPMFWNLSAHSSSVISNIQFSNLFVIIYHVPQNTFLFCKTLLQKHDKVIFPSVFFILYILKFVFLCVFLCTVFSYKCFCSCIQYVFVLVYKSQEKLFSSGSFFYFWFSHVILGLASILELPG